MQCLRTSILILSHGEEKEGLYVFVDCRQARAIIVGRHGSAHPVEQACSLRLTCKIAVALRCGQGQAFPPGERGKTRCGFQVKWQRSIVARIIVRDRYMDV